LTGRFDGLVQRNSQSQLSGEVNQPYQHRGRVGQSTGAHNTAASTRQTKEHDVVCSRRETQSGQNQQKRKDEKQSQKVLSKGVGSPWRAPEKVNAMCRTASMIELDADADFNNVVQKHRTVNMWSSE
jgi:hypothetical protein